MEVVLYNSTVCRLCAEENDNGTFLYSTEENNENISDLVNAYLPIKVSLELLMWLYWLDKISKMAELFFWLHFHNLL